MQNNLPELTKLIRYNILTSTTEAGSGHPTSSLSGVELLTALMFAGYFMQDLRNPRVMTNDRLVFSKGHASPLLYSLYAAAGGITRDELMSLRKFGSKIEGHPTPGFKYADVASGSLGQGLSIGLGMALGIKLRIKNQELRIKGREPKVFVLMGDSEVAEGQVYEAAQAAAFYKVNNLVGILDVNRLGQRGPTMLQWDLATYQKRFESFGWNAVVIDDGHSLEHVQKAYDTHLSKPDKPTIFIARTMKGKGVSFLADQDNWHGKSVPKDKLDTALKEIGKVDMKLSGAISAPQGSVSVIPTKAGIQSSTISFTSPYSTREAYGDALTELGKTDPNIVAVDGETGNSTFLEKFQKEFPDRYFEMYIAEQNMIGVAVGIQKLGFKPYAATFSAFLTRAFDQIRMAQYSESDLNICGSHAGVSIGQDGSSQMGLEDIAMMRSIRESTVLYPSDPYQTYDLMKHAHDLKGITYIRTSREKGNVLYSEKDTFKIGGSKVLKESEKDVAVIFAAGITLHEALKAYETVQKEQIAVCIVDLYSVKPLDVETITRLAKKCKNVIVVEDHYPYGGIGEAVSTVILSGTKDLVQFKHLCVRKMPHSGAPQELLHMEEIDADAIVTAVKSLK